MSNRPKPSLTWHDLAIRLAMASEGPIGHRVLSLLVHESFCYAGFDNDPSAGSPTETLLRLLLPLNDKVQWTSRDIAGGEPPTIRDPNTSPDHSIGRSDGRCVQR